MAANEGDRRGGEDGATGSHRGPGRPRDPGYDKAILDATLEILNDKGYSGLTIDGVAAKTGVGRPTIYRRWRSKPALVIAALTAAPSLAPAPDTGRLRDDLLAFERDQVVLMDRPESRRITAGLVADLVDDPELADAYLGDYVELRQASVSQAVQRGIERGELRADSDQSLIYDLLIGPLFLRSVVRGEPLGPNIAEQIVDLVLTVFGSPEPSRTRHPS
jgi:AcrR family transcriptional regulator